MCIRILIDSPLCSLPTIIAVTVHKIATKSSSNNPPAISMKKRNRRSTSLLISQKKTREMQTRILKRSNHRKSERSPSVTKLIS